MDLARVSVVLPALNEAAALPVAYGTAHRMLITHDTVKKGDRVLVLGASGGVGTGCIILAKHLGADVIACTSSVSRIATASTSGAGSRTLPSRTIRNACC